MPDTGPDTVSASARICNQKGLHARASAKFVKLAEQFRSDITVSKDGDTVGATSIMGLMMLAAGPGSEILIRAHGADAEAAVSALVALVASGFGEDQAGRGAS